MTSDIKCAAPFSGEVTGERVPLTVEDAARSRRSIRAFLPRPIPRGDLEQILSIAGTAPSGSNTQPWRVYVLRGEPLRKLGNDIQRAYLDGEPGHAAEYKHYAAPLPEPYYQRRRACGWGLYGVLGISRGDREGSKAYRARNYDFFGAPAGIVFTIDRRLEPGSWLDYGMFLQTVMLTARSLGLHTCAEGSIAEFPNVVRQHLPLSETELVLCGMA